MSKFKTLGALVEKVTSDSDLEFLPASELDAFFLTYQGYTTSAKLLRAFIKRFERVTRKGEHLAQLRTLQVMEHWVKNHWSYFSAEESLRVRMLQFVETKMESEGTHGENTLLAGKPLLRKIATLLKDNRSAFRTKQHRQISIAPKSILPRNGLENLSLLNVDPVEIARQLTLVESALFR
jgi:hypothetical protein